MKSIKLLILLLFIWTGAAAQWATTTTTTQTETVSGVKKIRWLWGSNIYSVQDSINAIFTGNHTIYGLWNFQQPVTFNGTNTTVYDSLIVANHLIMPNPDQAASIDTSWRVLMNPWPAGNKLQIATVRQLAGVVSPFLAGTYAPVSGSLTPYQRAMTDGSGNITTQPEILHQPVKYATVAALPANTYSNGAGGLGATLTATANGTLVVDGVIPSVGDRILVWQEATAANNGIYTVTQIGTVSTPYILTRGNYSAVAANLNAGAQVYVQAGNVLAGNTFQQTTTGTITIGTTALTWKNVQNASGWYNGENYGLDPTGTNDCTAALTALEALMPARGGTVYLPAGDWKLASTFVPNKNIRIVGDGPNAGFMDMYYPSGTTIYFPYTPVTRIIYTNSSTPCFTLSGQTAFNIENLEIYYSGSTPTSGNVAMLFTNAGRTHLTNISIEGFYDGITWSAGSFEGSADNVAVSGVLHNGLSYDNSTWADHGDFSWFGLVIRPTGSANAAIFYNGGGGLKGNNWKINWRDPVTGTANSFAYGIYMANTNGNTSNCQVSNCSIENCGQCIYQAPGTAPFGTIMFNNLECAPSNTSLSAIYLNGTSSIGTMSGITIRGLYNSSVPAIYLGANVSNFTVGIDGFSPSTTNWISDNGTNNQVYDMYSVTASSFGPRTSNQSSASATHPWLVDYFTNARIGVNGILKGNTMTSNISAAVANTDYLPATSQAVMTGTASGSGNVYGFKTNQAFTPTANNAVLIEQGEQGTFNTGTGLLTATANTTSDYTNGTYTNVPAVNILGTGTGAQFTVVVSGGNITSLTQTASASSGYAVGNTFGFAAGFDGGTATDFVGTVATLGYTGVIQLAQFLNAPTQWGSIAAPANLTNGMFWYQTDGHFHGRAGGVTYQIDQQVSSQANNTLFGNNSGSSAVPTSLTAAQAQAVLNTATPQLITGTPTIAAGTGAGTSPTVSVTTNGKQLKVTVTTGTLPAGTNATIASVTLPNALSYTPNPVFSAANANAAALSGATSIYVTSSNTANVTISSGTTALIAATTYIWNISL